MNKAGGDNLRKPLDPKTIALMRIQESNARFKSPTRLRNSSKASTAKSQTVAQSAKSQTVASTTKVSNVSKTSSTKSDESVTPRYNSAPYIQPYNSGTARSTTYLLDDDVIKNVAIRKQQAGLVRYKSVILRAESMRRREAIAKKAIEKADKVYNNLELEKEAAICIQRFVRGWIQRKLFAKALRRYRFEKAAGGELLAQINAANANAKRANIVFGGAFKDGQRR